MTDQTTPRRVPRLYLLFICLLVIGAGNSMLLAVAPPLVRDLGLSDASVGWIFSPSALLWVFCSPYWGRYSDRAGRKATVAMGLAAFAISMAAFATVVVVGSEGWLVGPALLTALIVSRCIFGAFGSASSPASQAYVADHTTQLQRTEQLALLSSAFALGQAFGPAVCAALAARLGLVFPIVLIAALGAISAFLVWRFLPEQKKPEAASPDALPLRGGDDNVNSLKLARDPRLSAYLLYALAMSTVTGVVTQVFGLFTMDRLNVAGEAGAELIAAGFMVSALALLATQMALLPRLKLTSRPLMAWGTVFIFAGLLIQIAAPSLGALLVSQAVQGIGFGLARPGFTGGASVAVRPHEQGAAAGLITAMNGAGFVISPLVGGVVYERFGMNAPLWVSLAILAAMLAFVLMSRRLRNRTLITPTDSPTP